MAICDTYVDDFEILRISQYSLYFQFQVTIARETYRDLLQI